MKLETPKWLAYLAIPTRNSQISILEETNTNSDRLSNPEIKHNEARDYSEPKTRLELSDASTYDLAGMHQLQNHVLDKGTDQQSKPTPLKPLLSTTVDTAVRDTRNPVACQTKIR
jgi:hypothetical protein